MTSYADLTIGTRSAKIRDGRRLRQVQILADTGLGAQPPDLTNTRSRKAGPICTSGLWQRAWLGPWLCVCGCGWRGGLTAPWCSRSQLHTNHAVHVAWCGGFGTLVLAVKGARLGVGSTLWGCAPSPPPPSPSVLDRGTRTHARTLVLAPVSEKIHLWVSSSGGGERGAAHGLGGHL